MRADAARNLEAVLMAGARTLAADAGASMADIAAEAGVDRRTVYRRFPSREALLAAVYKARLDAIEAVIGEARLREAPAQVALHRYVEGVIEVNRTWPVDLARMLTDAPSRERRDHFVHEVDAFIQRATDEGLFRPGLPPGWAAALIPLFMHQASRKLPQLTPGQAADIVVDSLLHGIGIGTPPPATPPPQSNGQAR
ncbi:transcriptional regulator, TetR family [Streptomyces sp. 2131.1]|uniref:TetR/AcrR family transcriptional regulator n=1 Tax=Streptomyces sp. 2131.1 TaxID=1855346 RepID=UPI00089977A9|nr:TetR/AcrR family transcriptional regulator [Streptomyces sp. 2131.1]SEE45492.1 transcriptional regulator, TetR family [Streptomyces sp. 2131.1]